MLHPGVHHCWLGCCAIVSGCASRALVSFRQALAAKVDDHVAASLAGDTLSSLASMQRRFPRGLASLPTRGVSRESLLAWLRPLRVPLDVQDIEARSASRLELLKSAVCVLCLAPYACVGACAHAVVCRGASALHGTSFMYQRSKVRGPRNECCASCTL